MKLPSSDIIRQVYIMINYEVARTQGAVNDISCKFDYRMCNYTTKTLYIKSELGELIECKPQKAPDSLKGYFVIERAVIVQRDLEYCTLGIDNTDAGDLTAEHLALRSDLNDNRLNRVNNNTSIQFKFQLKEVIKNEGYIYFDPLKLHVGFKHVLNELDTLNKLPSFNTKSNNAVMLGDLFVVADSLDKRWVCLAGISFSLNVFLSTGISSGLYRKTSEGYIRLAGLEGKTICGVGRCIESAYENYVERLSLKPDMDKELAESIAVLANAGIGLDAIKLEAATAKASNDVETAREINEFKAKTAKVSMEAAEHNAKLQEAKASAAHSRDVASTVLDGVVGLAKAFA